MKTVHVVGNSHVMYFVGEDVPFDSERTFERDSLRVFAFKAGNTGATVYSLSKVGSTTDAGKKISEYVQKNKPQNLVFVLGDVDFREHMVKHLTHGYSSVASFMEEISTRYRDYIRSLAEHVSGKIFVTGMVPFSEEYYRFKLGEDLKNGVLWFVAERFNGMLLDMACSNGWGFISLSGLADARGFLKKEYVMNPFEVHANPRLVRDLILEQLEARLGQS